MAFRAASDRPQRAGGELIALPKRIPCCALGRVSGLFGWERVGIVTRPDRQSYEEFVRLAEPRLVRALVPVLGVDDAADAAAEAVAYAWEHWERINAMENPIGFVYRVAQSRSRKRREGLLPDPGAVGLPDIEPGLVPALRKLPETQRTAVWLIHACDWSYAEAADAMGVSVTAVGTHVSRALTRLRQDLEVKGHA